MGARRVGLYSPYFGTVWGGGEKYLACTARALKDAHPDLAVEISAPVPVDPEACRRILGVDLSGISLHSTNRRVTPLHRALNRAAIFRPLRDRVLSAQASRAGLRYDVYLPMVYSIPVRSAAPRNAVLCQFPYPHPGGELSAVELIVCQSRYVQEWVRRYWERESVVVNPPIDVPAAEPDWTAKRRVVLSVGRFFSGGHSKRQDLLVDAFRRLVDAGLRGWELHLAGSVHRDAGHRGFFERVQSRARGYPIHLHPDVPRAELDNLYRSASIYWHAAGFRADSEAEPERLEHFGMTTAEAMAHGAVPIVYAAGGQLEVVSDGEDGYHWRAPEELLERTGQLVADEGLRLRTGAAARRTAARWARPIFAASIARALEPVLGGGTRG